MWSNYHLFYCYYVSAYCMFYYIQTPIHLIFFLVYYFLTLPYTLYYFVQTCICFFTVKLFTCTLSPVLYTWLIYIQCTHALANPAPYFLLCSHSNSTFCSIHYVLYLNLILLLIHSVVHRISWRVFVFRARHCSVRWRPYPEKRCNGHL